MEHSFNVEIAAQYGIHTAILLKNIHFWIVKNRANEKHFHNGRYWTYNSQKAFSELFPYLTERQVKYTIEKMKKDELILIDNFNENPYDKTSWYALTDKALKLLGDTSEVPETLENIDSTKLSHRIDKNVPIDKTKLSHRKNEIVSSYKDTDNKPNINNKKKKKTFDEIIEDYTDNEELKADLKEHLRTRKSKKGTLNNRAIELSLKELDKLANTDTQKIQIVRNAIMRGYSSFWPVKDYENNFENQKSSYDIEEYEKFNPLEYVLD